MTSLLNWIGQERTTEKHGIPSEDVINEALFVRKEQAIKLEGYQIFDNPEGLIPLFTYILNEVKSKGYLSNNESLLFFNEIDRVNKIFSFDYNFLTKHFHNRFSPIKNIYLEYQSTAELDTFYRIRNKFNKKMYEEAIKNPSIYYDLMALIKPTVRYDRNEYSLIFKKLLLELFNHGILKDKWISSANLLRSQLTISCMNEGTVVAYLAYDNNGNLTCQNGYSYKKSLHKTSWL